MLKWSCGPGARAFVLATIAALPLLAGADESAVREYLDEDTAATITTAREPLIFARERRDLAVNARDYVSLAPIEVNRAGKRSYYWFAYLWSSIDRREGEAPMAPEDELVLMADGRPLKLQASISMHELGVARPPIESPRRQAVPVLYPVEPEAVNFVSHAGDLSLTLIHEGLAVQYTLWKDARAQIRAWSEHLALDTP